MTSRTVTVLSCILFSIPLHAAVKDFGLKEYVYVSKDLPQSENDTWTLVCQLPHNAQFQLWLEVESPVG